MLPSGLQMIDGDTINALASQQGLEALYGLTAAADGTRASATALNYGLNRVATVAGAADSVVLPPAVGGTMALVQNAGASDMQVFAQGSDLINATAGATGVNQATGVSALYFCVLDGYWARILSA
jgi:hypothetical protein